MAILRRAEVADIPGVQALVAGIYADYSYVLDLVREDPHLADPLSYFRKNGGEFWTLHESAADPPVVGCCGVRFDPGQAAEIRAVYVHRNHRRQGWARRMVLLAMDHACQAGKPRIYLWSDIRFIEAHRLYESLGFRQTDSRHMECANVYSEYFFELFDKENMNM